MPKSAQSAQKCPEHPKVSKIAKKCPELPNLRKLYHQVFFRTPCTLSQFHPGELSQSIVVALLFLVLKDPYFHSKSLLCKEQYWPYDSPGRSVLKIHFFLESGLKMIQFKTKSVIFIHKNIHSIESRIFDRIIHSQKRGKLFKFQN